MASITAPKYAAKLTVSDGTNYGYIRLPAQAGKPTLLFLHGYPSSTFHWHNQVKQCVDAGYGMIAPDLLGYGDTDKPAEPSAYDNTRIARHVNDILEHEKIPVVVGVGHDWGAIFMSVMARMYPQRFALLVFLAVGYGVSQAALTNVDAVNAHYIKAIGRPLLGYWLFHNKPEAVSVIENANPDSLGTLLYPADPALWRDEVCPPGKMEAWIRSNRTTSLAPWLPREDLATHTKIMLAGGYTGPLNWYKQAMAGVTHASEAKINAEYATTKITVPTLFVGTERDEICVPAVNVAGMKDHVPDLTIRSLPTGHWIMLEKPVELWEIMHSWIEEKRKNRL